MNIPNCITIFRILLIPLLVILLLEGRTLTAFWVVVVAGFSDALDGFLARVMKQKTDFGAFIDPLADKLLLITSFITLAVLDILPEWLAVVVVSRDVLILGGIGILMLFGRSIAIRPSLLSKATTFLQLVTVVFHLGHEYIAPLQGARLPLISLTALFTILSGAHYIVIGFRILGNPDVILQKNKQ